MNNPDMMRILILYMLDDDSGINARAYRHLCDMEDELKPTIPDISDILDRVIERDGRFSLSVDDSRILFHE